MNKKKRAKHMLKKPHKYEVLVESWKWESMADEWFCNIIVKEDTWNFANFDGELFLVEIISDDNNYYNEIVRKKIK